jgi:hypothetical protein
MKLTKILLCLAPLAFAGFVRAEETSTQVIELPAVVVEATRLPDPVATMKAALERRVQVAPPTRLVVKLAPISQLANDEKPATTDGQGATFSFRPARRAPAVL